MGNQPVGLLWDSVSDNTGDQAIGLLMQRFLEQRMIAYEALNPFSYDQSRYSTIIVGGGELLQAIGNPFYDRFRVPGSHILNTVGLGDPDACEYLNEYRLVTVRSQTEKEFLQQFVPEVEASPCVTMLMAEYFPPSPENDFRKSISKDTVGIHLHYGLVAAIPNIFAAIKKLNARHKLEFVPFTQYNGDRQIMEQISCRLSHTSISPAQDPIAKFHRIGGLRALVCSSLHAAIYAYAQGIPVLAFPYVPKLRYFFEERGLADWLFYNEEELLWKMEKLESNQPDYRQSLEADKKAAKTHLDKIAEALTIPSESSSPAIAPISVPGNPSLKPVSQVYHQLLMEHCLTTGQLYAEVLNLRIYIQENQRRYGYRRSSKVLWQKARTVRLFSRLRHSQFRPFRLMSRLLKKLHSNSNIAE